MKALPPKADVTSAWVAALAATAQERGGRLQHLVVTVEEPGPPDQRFVALADAVLVPARHSVSTVASTIFPSSMYADPQVTFEPGMPEDKLARLDLAANDLYDNYRQMLPTLRAFPGNAAGTYFGRLVAWPSSSPEGYNQLAVRIRQLRGKRGQNDSAMNAADLVVEGAAEQDLFDDGVALQVYKSSDERLEAFPCLVHLDISVINDRVSLLAVYRHWHMIAKAYGNLVGLARLQHFLAQQTGYAVGELVVHGTASNAQFSDFNRREVAALIERLQAVTDRPGA